MHDCDDADIRDLLPDYAHGTLTPVERAQVEAHLGECEACGEELALLRAVRANRIEPRVPDVASIVAALPTPQRARVASEQVVAIDSWHRSARPLPWRRIAGVAALLVGVIGVGLFGRRAGVDGGEPAVSVDPVVVTDSRVPGTQPAATESAAPRVGAAPDTPRAPIASERASRAGGAEALGALGGIASGASDDELQALIGGLESLSGIPDVESAEGEESVRVRGGRR
jgi:hypothetical protein